jgi:hypothetical protein
MTLKNRILTRWVLVVVGAALALLGTVWTLQGLGYIGGSSMTGDRLWAIIGPIAALIGMLLIVGGLRKSRT